MLKHVPEKEGFLKAFFMFFFNTKKKLFLQDWSRPSTNYELYVSAKETVDAFKNEMYKLRLEDWKIVFKIGWKNTYLHCYYREDIYK